MACEAIKKAMADAGLEPRDIDGMTSYQAGDSTTSNHVATSLGMRLNYSVDIMGGGSSTEALIGNTIGLLEAGYCKSMVIFRSMNGRSGRRMGGQAPSGPVPPTRAAEDNQFMMPWGWTSPAQLFGMSAMRYLRDTGTTTKSLAEIAVAHRRHASLNPKAIMRNPITIEDHQNSDAERQDHDGDYDLDHREAGAAILPHSSRIRSRSARAAHIPTSCPMGRMTRVVESAALQNSRFTADPMDPGHDGLA
jgi:acetyl-CoA acetyltransferase